MGNHTVLVAHTVSDTSRTGSTPFDRDDPYSNKLRVHHWLGTAVNISLLSWETCINQKNKL